jgi:hypothetical protein
LRPAIRHDVEYLARRRRKFLVEMLHDLFPTRSCPPNALGKGMFLVRRS